MDLLQAALLDFAVLFTCAILLWRHARLSVLHPGAVYLFFHILVFSSRAFFILVGAPTLFTGWPRTLPISQSEIAWAINLADIALVSMTVAWIKVASDDLRRHEVATGNDRQHPGTAMLSEKVIWRIGAIAFPIGIAALVYFVYVPTTDAFGGPRIDLGEWNSSSWTMVTQSWSGLVLLSFIYYYGFRKLFVIPMGAYLLLMAMQGFDRFRVILPLIYLLLVWLSRKTRKWPPLWMLGAVLAVVALMFPMKIIGHMMQKGEPVADIIEASANSLADVASGHSGDQMVLDEFASTVSLVEESHRYYYGTLYYPLLTVAIPRQWWPDKPALNWYQHDLSRPWRPMAMSGMVATIHGESYANFGIFGIIIISPVVAYWLGRLYFAALRKSYFSVYRFTYIMVACNFIQIFRDGLISLVLFTLVNMTPLVAVAVLSYISFRRKRTWSSPHSSSFLRHEGQAAQV